MPRIGTFPAKLNVSVETKNYKTTLYSKNNNNKIIKKLKITMNTMNLKSKAEFRVLRGIFRYCVETVCPAFPLFNVGEHPETQHGKQF